jgi:ribosome maturation factor RimP
MSAPLNNPEQLERLREVAGVVCSAHGVSLVDARFVVQRGTVLQVLIERPDAPPGHSGVTLDDCQAVSRDLSTALDVEDEALPRGAYRLEVSSPGVERPLVRPHDYVRFAGCQARIKTRVPVAERRNFAGTLRGTSARDDSVLVEMTVEGREVEIPFDAIAKAHLVFRF